MINIIIFSKDRSCQLELLLRSMKAFFPESSFCNVSILYKYSNDSYRKGYDKTKYFHPEFKYILEEDGGFKRQLLNLIDERCAVTMFLVDDIVFKDYFFIKSNEVRTFLNNQDIACLSLRMCPRINYCYTEKRSTPPPILSDTNTWEWVGLPGDWGYPHSLDAHLFRTAEIMHLMRTMDYWNPNTLEGTWANHPPLGQPYMVCFNESKIVNNPVNKVQTANGNHCGDISADFINGQYLLDNVISLRPFVGIKNMSAHQEVGIAFVRSYKYTADEMVSVINSKRIDYEKIIRNSMFVPRTNPADINLFIPVKGRVPFLDPCVKYIKKAVDQGPYKVKIAVIENSETPEFYGKAEALGVDYIYIPIGMSQSDGMFAKSLCYNVGYLLSKPAKWNIFHDLDILVQPDYFEKLKVYIDTNPRWIQPYTQRRVLRISDDYTNRICLGDHMDLDSIPGGHVVASNPGSPGGSIVIRSDVFEEVGGYDPELFYGYAPEDDFLWTKLEVSTAELNVITSCFASGGVFANSPSMEVYHMFHMPTENNNDKYRGMLEYKASYYRYAHADKLKIVNIKREIFKEAHK